MTAAPRVPTQTITYRGNAQQDYISDSMKKATIAVSRLQSLNISVEHVELGGGGKPKIRVGWNPRVDGLGVPRSFSKGNNGLSYETYLVDFEQCQVSWIKK
ncbi:hypothetical protein [uncultured Endozoicomonas sp.]|uniref:hypothetical protein n=1 Tax=uncultured Endozoicomonas sp. TaxID=432652 RepID=UPI002611981F|nr:hypothetical protein [uncultured Endozoicomonas sp.]